jgi:choline kinase
MDRALLITANGDGTRMGSFFGIPKHLLFYKGRKILDWISERGINSGFEMFLAVQTDDGIHHEGLTKIICGRTESRMETISVCLPYLQRFHSVLVHDCDVLFPEDMLQSMDEDAISVSIYPKDEKKYGFVDIDKNFSYLNGNEKQKEAPFVATGLYSFRRRSMEAFLKNNVNPTDTMLDYYNLHHPELIFAKDFINLGDIQSYMSNL